MQKEFQCEICHCRYSNPVNYCLHKDHHRFSSRLLCCCFCTEIFGSAHEFMYHKCIDTFLKNPEPLREPIDTMTNNDQITHEVKRLLLNCLFCNGQYRYSIFHFFLLFLFWKSRKYYFQVSCLKIGVAT